MIHSFKRKMVKKISLICILPLFFFLIIGFSSAWTLNSITTNNSYIVNNGISYLNPQETSGSYLGRSYIQFNITSNLTGFSNLTFYLYNSTRALIVTNFSTNRSIYINISSLVDGLWFFNATAINSSNWANSTAIINVTIDTTYPTINIGTGTETSGVFLKRNDSYVNITSEDTNLKNITIYLYNSSFSLINSSNGTANYLAINFTGLSDGIYYFNASACDRADNCNSSGFATRNVTIDTIIPPISDVSSSVNSTTATITWTTNEESNSTVYYGTTVTTSSISPNSSNVTSHSVVLTSLDSSTLYYYNVSSCDYANNCNTSTQSNFTTSAAATTTSSGSGSNTVSGLVIVYYPTDSDLANEKEYTKELRLNLGMRVKVENRSHYVGVVGITNTTATINVSSTPQQAIFNAGDEKKFDVNSDNYYDIYVRLNNIINLRANVTIKLIHELKTTLTGGDQNASGNFSSVGDGSEATDKDTSSIWGKWWFWTIIVIIIVIVVVLGIRFYNHKKIFSF